MRLVSLLLALTLAVPAGAQVITLVDAEINGVDGVVLDNPQDVALSPDGRHVYAVALISDAVAVFARDRATAALTPVATVTSGGATMDGPQGVIVSPDGAHVYVASVLSDDVSVFARDAVTGLLTPLQTVGTAVSPALDGARALGISPDGATVYVAAGVADAVVALARDAATGLLTFVEAEVEGSGGTTGLDGAINVRVSPDGTSVYVAGSVSDAIAVFSRDLATGALTFVEAPTGTHLNSARDAPVSPDGRHVYVPALSSDAVSVYARDAATGALTFVQTVTNGEPGVFALDAPNRAVLSPDGRILYVTSSTSDALVTFLRNRVTGELSPFVSRVDESGGVTTLNGANGVAVSSDGADVYVTAGSDDALTAFRAGVTQPDLYNPTPGANDGAGWRMLSPPVSPLTVTDLAQVNLVQGVPAGAPAEAYPAQYPAAGDNLLTGFDGTAFTVPTAADDALEPGLGFFWYLYDLDIAPSDVPPAQGTGTSRSEELDNPMFALTMVGYHYGVDVPIALAPRAPGQSYAYLLGNPYAEPFAVSGIQVSGGTLSGGVVYVWDPAVPGYVTLSASNGDLLAPWQGFFGIITPPGPPPPPLGGGPTVTYLYASRDPAATPPFYGRPGPHPPQVRFRLAGTLASGARVGDGAAVVRFLDGAAEGRDALDAPTAPQPGPDVAVLTPVVDGAALAVDSRPLGKAARTPLALATSDAATLTLDWTLDGPGGTWPAGWTARLHDLATGQTHDLTTAAPLVVDAAAGTSERFELVVTPAGIVASGTETPLATALAAPAPNPTAGASRVAFALAQAGAARLVVVDALGREVAVVTDAALGAGPHETTVATDRLAPGVYVLRLTAGGETLTQTLTVVR